MTQSFSTGLKTKAYVLLFLYSFPKGVGKATQDLVFTILKQQDGDEGISASSIIIKIQHITYRDWQASVHL